MSFLDLFHVVGRPCRGSFGGTTLNAEVPAVLAVIVIVLAFLGIGRDGTGTSSY
jgi:hypothetical protein